MTTLTLAMLDSPLTRGASLGEAIRGAESAQRVAAFDEALGRQGVGGVQVAEVAGAAPVTDARAVAAPAPAEAADGRDRVRRALELDGAEAKPKASGGDTILDGLQRLRGTFDARQARVAEVMNGPGVDAHSLLAMQVEVVNFTMLVDVTSKLTGKSTQAFDTLMKGQ